MTEIGIATALFSSAQGRVLALIFGHPNRGFYTSEIVRNVRSEQAGRPGAIAFAAQLRLVSVERIGNQKHYRANRQSPVFKS